MSEAGGADALGQELVRVAQDAGTCILRVYRSGFEVTHKADRSPLTEADLAAHRLISEALQRLTPGIPLLSEEASHHVAWEERRGWSCYWLVDPLDGTREFVRGNGEFAVNIALIEGGAPTLAVVHAPTWDETYVARRGGGAYRVSGQRRSRLRVRTDAPMLRLVGSRSHHDARLPRLLERLPGHIWDALGASLKFCRIASGQADLYVRYGATCAWDTAAGQLIVEEAGGAVTDFDFQPLRYNQGESLLNPEFVAFAHRQHGWPELLEK